MRQTRDNSIDREAEPGNDNVDKVVRYDEKAWRRAYMRRYMRERRQQKQGEEAK